VLWEAEVSNTGVGLSLAGTCRRLQAHTADTGASEQRPVPGVAWRGVASRIAHECMPDDSRQQTGDRRQQTAESGMQSLGPRVGGGREC